MKDERLRLVLWAGLLFVITAVAYMPVLHCGFIWDDDAYVTQNRPLQDAGGLRKIWLKPSVVPQYYPLTHTTLWLEYRFYGNRATGYHIDNVLLHGVNAILLWMLLRRLNVPGSWFAAAIFALHPVHVESVAWITERKNVLSGMFYLSSILAYLKFADGRQRYYWLALALFVCALFSKTVTCTLPAAVLLILWWKRGRVEWRDVMLLLPFFTAGIVSGLATAWLEVNNASATGPEWEYSLVERFLIAGRALWFYAGKLVWPVNLTFSYPQWRIDSDEWTQFVFPLGFCAVVAMLWFRRAQWGKAPLVAVFYFAGTLAPALGFFNLYPMRYTFVADHFQYLASISLIALGVAGASRLPALRVRVVHAQSGHPTATMVSVRRGMITGGLVILTCLWVLTWRQTQIYKDMETLWRDTVAKNPASWLACNNLGGLVLARGKITDSIELFQRVLVLKPGFAEAHNNLGAALTQAGKPEDAIGHLEQALQIKPDYADAHFNLGNALLQVGKLERAIGHYQQALQIKPDYAEAHTNLGNALVQTGRIQDAIWHYEQALRIKSDYAEAHCNLGFALQKAGRFVDAIGHLEQALQIKPDYADAHFNLGNALVQVGKLEQAVGHYQQVLQIRPEYAEAHTNLGITLVRLGMVQEGIGHLEQAVQIKPDYAKAQYDLGAALEQAGKLQNAMGHYERALGIKPDFTEARNAIARLQAGQ